MAAIHVMMLILGLAAWHMEGVAGDCCNKVTFYATTANPTLPGRSFLANRINNGHPSTWAKCGDCSDGNPHCGVTQNSCNKFGCNCNCRQGSGTCYCRDQVCQPQTCLTCQAESSTADSVIKMADVDQDGRLSYKEARAHLGDSNEINDAGLEALDLNSDGYLTADEIDPSGHTRTLLTTPATPEFSRADYELFPGQGHYKFNTTAVTWPVARDACAAEGSHLMIFDSQEEVEVFKTLFAKQPATIPGASSRGFAWLGVYRPMLGAGWVTVLGDSWQPTSYARWVAGRPGTKYGYDYVLGNHLRGGLFDTIIFVKYPFVCEHKL